MQMMRRSGVQPRLLVRSQLLERSPGEPLSLRPATELLAQSS